jgi:hypothetical protein
LFSPEVIAAVIGGLFSLAATLISLRANRRSQGARDQVEGVRSQVDRLGDQLLDLRLEPYKELWSLTKWPSQPSEEGLTPKQRKELLSERRSWYFQGEGGILLSEEARVLFREAQRQLEATDPKPTAEEIVEIRQKLSELRTQMRRDLGFG